MKKNLFRIIFSLFVMLQFTSVYSGDTLAYVTVANPVAGQDGSVAVFDVTTSTFIGSPIPVGIDPLGIAVTPDGQYTYVVNSGSDSISIIENATNTVVNTIDTLALGQTAPQLITIADTPNGIYAYITGNGTNGNVLVIDTVTQAPPSLSFTNPIMLGGVNGANPYGIAITPNGSPSASANKAYVACSGTTHTTVYVINTTTNTVATSISSIFGQALGPEVAITPNGLYAYVTIRTGIGEFIYIQTSSNTIQGSVNLLDPQGIVIGSTVNGDYAYIAEQGVSQLEVFNTTTQTVVPVTIQTGSLPYGVAISSDNATVLSANSGSSSINITNTNTNTNAPSSPVSIPGGGAPFYIAFLLPDPLIASISPTSGSTAGGTPVTITGVNFTGATAVNFGVNAAQSFIVNSDTSISAVSPAGAAGTINVTVVTPAGTSPTGPTTQFTYTLSLPSITSISPTSGSTAGGTPVTITGLNFTGTTAVNFGINTAQSFTVNSDTSITAISPAGAAGTVNITVVTPNGTSSTGPTNQFTYTVPFLPPKIVSGYQVKDKFATQTDIVNKIQLQTPNDALSPSSYIIYRDAALSIIAGTLSAQGPLLFLDHNRHKNEIYTYYIVSVVNNMQSAPVMITVLPQQN